MPGALVLFLALSFVGGGTAALQHASAGIHWYENRGQYPGEISFGMWTPGAWVGVARDKILFQAPAVEGGGITEVELRFEGARAVEPQGVGPEPGLHHAYIGNDPDQWITSVRTFAAVRLEGLYEGIDLELRDREGYLKYDIFVAPGADLSRIVVSLNGAAEAQLDSEELIIRTSAGELKHHRPLSWQVTPDGMQVLEVRYRVLDSQRFGFEAPDRDPRLPLVIDPELTWSTYWGGKQTTGSIGDSANDVLVDEAGYLYVAGTVEGVNSLITPGAYQLVQGGDDIFVAKLEQAGGHVVYSARIGSSGTDNGMAIDVDEQGRATVVGWAGQSVTNFPTTPGAFDTETTGFRRPAVVFRLSADGGTLEYSTYLESSLGANARAVKVAASGSAIVAGQAHAEDFPTTPGAYNTTGYQPEDAFVTRLDPTGSFLEWSTFLGGAGVDPPLDMAIDDQEQVVVVGYTGSPDFPTTPGVVGPSFIGQWDGFATKFSSDGSSLIWSTFLGGTDIEQTHEVGLLPSGDVVLAGMTESTDFPVTPGAFQQVNTSTTSPPADAFLARLDASAENLSYATYLGGEGPDWGFGVAVDRSGVVTVAGSAGSIGFPTTPGSFQETIVNDSGFVTRFRPDGSSLLYSTVLGDTFSDGANATALSPSDLVTVVGRTTPPFPTTPNALFPNPIGGQSDGFITTLRLVLEGVHTLGTSLPACLGPINANATTMPIAGQPFGLYCSQAPPDANGILFSLTGDGTPSINLVQSDANGYVETDVGTLPSTPGKRIYYRFAFRNWPFAGFRAPRVG
jgi:hypothetical protein